MGTTCQRQHLKFTRTSPQHVKSERTLNRLFARGCDDVAIGELLCELRCMRVDLDMGAVEAALAAMEALLDAIDSLHTEVPEISR